MLQKSDFIKYFQSSITKPEYKGIATFVKDSENRMDINKGTVYQDLVQYDIFFQVVSQIINIFIF